MAFQTVSLEYTVTQRQVELPSMTPCSDWCGKSQVGVGVGTGKFWEALHPRRRGSGWVLWKKSSPESPVGIWVSGSS